MEIFLKIKQPCSHCSDLTNIRSGLISFRFSVCAIMLQISLELASHFQSAFILIHKNIGYSTVAQNCIHKCTVIYLLPSRLYIYIISKFYPQWTYCDETLLLIILVMSPKVKLLAVFGICIFTLILCYQIAFWQNWTNLYSSQ